MASTSTTDSASRVTDYFDAHPRAMTMMAARELDLPEAEVLGHLPRDYATPLAAARFEKMMDSLADYGKVTVIISNGATTVEVSGQFGNFSTAGPFFNVQSPTLDMHIRHEKIGKVFAVEKPGHLDGVPTLSLQFYDLQGASAFKVFLTFGEQAPTETCRAWWNTFRDDFAV